jgi:hypothetical protein
LRRGETKKLHGTQDNGGKKLKIIATRTVSNEGKKQISGTRPHVGGYVTNILLRGN